MTQDFSIYHKAIRGVLPKFVFPFLPNEMLVFRTPSLVQSSQDSGDMLPHDDGEGAAVCPGSPLNPPGIAYPCQNGCLAMAS